MDVLIDTPTDVGCLSDLARDAERDGHRMVLRLITDWQDGTNRFERPGESLYVATIGDAVVGVCGLNVDPYVEDPSVGRVRRLYVAVEHRRSGIGSLLVARVLDDAMSTFAQLRLRTRDPTASAFYRSHGFVEVQGDAACTHERTLR